VSFDWNFDCGFRSGVIATTNYLLVTSSAAGASAVRGCIDMMESVEVTIKRNVV